MENPINIGTAEHTRRLILRHVSGSVRLIDGPKRYITALLPQI